MPTKSSGWLLVAAILLSAPTPSAAAESVAPENVDKVGSISDDKPKSDQQAAEEISLERLLELAIDNSPGLRARVSAVHSAEGELAQSSAWSNPEISVEAENLAGSGDYRGTKSGEITFGVSQQLQMGGKISARQSIAQRGLEISRLDQTTAALDLVRDVTVSYSEVVAAEEIHALATEQNILANDVLQSVSKRVGAAASPLAQKSRAEVELFTSQITLEAAMRRSKAARRDLAGLLAQDDFLEPVSKTAFYTVTAPADGSPTLNTSIPEFARLDKSLERANAELDLEKANAIPDLSVNLGVRELRETGDRAFLLGASIPAPVFDANRGSIEAARHRVLQLESENQAFRTEQKISYAKANAEMLDAYRRTELLKTKILPSAQEAFRLSREGYELGRFPYLEVLDAQRSLFEVKQQLIEATKDYQTAKANAERLSAKNSSVIEKGPIHAE